MRRIILFSTILLIAATGFAGFKAKQIRSKKPEKYQARAVLAGVTVAADLLLDAKEQAGFFYKELRSNGIVPLRLAIFNNSSNEVLIPMEGIKLIGPDGQEIPAIDAETVAHAVLQGVAVPAEKRQSPVQVGVGSRGADPRYDPRDPRYDPQVDPSDPRYDPRTDPTDPRYDPADPRNRGYGNRGIFRPGVDVVWSPPGTVGNSEEITKRLIEKDFSDKAYSADPVMPHMMRDRFIYFQMDQPPEGVKGFELHLPQGQDLPQSIKLIF